MNYLIKNATIVDGTGQTPFQGDILIENGLIKSIGNLPEKGNFQLIDGDGLVVTPGFIDTNCHSDVYWTLFDYPLQESFLSQGITTIICGNCGASLAPIINEEATKSFQKYTDTSKSLVNWTSFEEYLTEIKKKGLGLNFSSLVGHTTLRRAFLGDDMRPATKEEIKLMSGSLERALNEGALGLSLGLAYTHAQSANHEELIPLAQVVAKHHGVLAAHVRSEREGFLDAINEVLYLARQTGVSLQISHLKVLGKKNWPQMERALIMIDEARGEGLNVNFDMCPYAQSGPVLYTLLPNWATEGGKKSLLRRLQDPPTRQKIIDEMHHNGLDFGEVMVATSKIGKSLSHHRVADIAFNQERSVEEVILDLILASDDRITSTIDLIDPKNVEKGILNEFSFVTTNGFALNASYKKEGDIVHPRCFGAMPKFLSQFVQEQSLLPLAQAIAKITLLPAQKFHLDRQVGSIAKDKLADLTVFDLEKLKDEATIENPYAYSQGVEYVFLAGKLVFEKGVFSNNKSGSIFSLKKGIF